MTLPADVTITVCGPAHSESQKRTLRAMENYFESIESDHFTVTVEIPSTSTLARHLTVRTTREEFIDSHNLVGLRFEEGSRSTGVAGTAKIWASVRHTIDAVLDLVGEHGGRILIPVKLPPRASQIIPLISTAQGQGAVGSGTSTSERSTSDWDPSKLTNGRAQTPVVVQPQLAETVVSKPSKPQQNPNNDSIVIRWPHPSFRFMFLGEPLKRSLNDLLENLRNIHSISTTCPYRDKTDQSACLLLEGSSGPVAISADEVNKFMRSVALQMRCVQLVLSESQRQLLIAQDLAKVKEVQGQSGVHMVLEPQPTDLAEATSSYDMRLPSNEIGGTEIGDEERQAMSDIWADTEIFFRPPKELLSVVVTSKVSGHPVVVTVVNNKCGGGGGGGLGWDWGVNNLLLVLDASADVGLNGLEIEQLNRGEVLVNAESSTGKRILRVRPEGSFIGLSTPEKQAEGLVSALSRGLAAADSLSLGGIAVVAPTANQCFSDLAPDLVRSLSVEAVVAFIRRAPVRCLERVLCIEIDYQADENFPSENLASSEACVLLPAGGDRMTMTLLILLEQANDRAGMNLQSFSAAPSMQILSCNVPLPRNVTAEALMITLPSQGSQVNQNPSSFSSHSHGRNSRGLSPTQVSSASPIVIRGLLRGLVSALRSIKQMLTVAN